MHLPGSSSMSTAFPKRRFGRLLAWFRERDFPRACFRGCSYFVMFRPPSLLASQIAPTAASNLAGQPRLFTSEQNVRRYLRTHRTCYPPDYRQLAERGLSPRKIRSFVGCSAGIEVGRADGKVEGYQSRPFGCEVGSHFHQRHVSRSPPIMPDGRVSQVRFEASAFRR